VTLPLVITGGVEAVLKICASPHVSPPSLLFLSPQAYFFVTPSPFLSPRALFLSPRTYFFCRPEPTFFVAPSPFFVTSSLLFFVTPSLLFCHPER
jgi:hypothetical protein